MSCFQNGKRRIIFIFFLGSFGAMPAQEIAVEAVVVDQISNLPLADVTVLVEGTFLEEKTNEDGYFSFGSDLPEGEHVLVFSKLNYLPVRFLVTAEKGKTRSLGIVTLQPQILPDQQPMATISLSDHELDEEEGGFDNISGLLQATKDVFLNAAAFDFSPTFFRPRGFDSDNGKLLINGIEMNKLFNGRPQWSDWGGLNDVQRNQVFSMGLEASEVSFGGLAGTTNIIMRASEYAPGGKISYAISNRGYSGRIMGSYSSGLLPNGWAYTFALSRRFAEESFRDGTIYDANSFFAAVEKEINSRHSLNFSGIFSPNRRGKSSANTQEVYDLKGIKYNSYWGYQEGEIRNSRIRNIREPILMLNHYWQISENISLNNNIAYQFGSEGNSRLDYGGSRLLTGPEGHEIFIGGGSNPDPAYYQKLPSYFLRFEDDKNYQAAYLAQQDFVENGQLDWNALYSANHIMAASGGNSIYILYEDRNEDQQFIANSILRAELTSRIILNGKISFRKLKSENFARILDLLGGNAFLDVDSFSEGDEAQNNLLNPNSLAEEGDKIKYHFDLNANVVKAFAQAQFKYKRFDSFIGTEISQTSYNRFGYFKNGKFPENSLGKSEILNFTDFGAKAGTTFKLSGRHLFNINAAWLTKPPTLRNSFSNTRQNNDVVANLKSEKIISSDISYIFRSRLIKARLTGYFTQLSDATEISFYYADGISGLGRNSTTAFVQEVLTDIQKRHFGGEIGMEALVTPDIKLKAVAAVGEFIYSNNPNLYLTSDDFDEALDFGASYLENYKIAGGPQKAYQFGVEYRDPDYWFFTASLNYFSDAFLDVAPLTRTKNFLTDADGLPLLNYDEEIAKKLLAQEEFDDYFLVNIVGGKSWRIKEKYIGFFASINNVLDVLHKTGGYEQSRNANYRTLKEDQEREQPIFGPKYWYGTGTTYYAHVYVRF